MISATSRSSIARTRPRPVRRARSGSASSAACGDACSGIRVISAPIASTTPGGRSGTGGSSAPSTRCGSRSRPAPARSRASSTASSMCSRVLDYVRVDDDGRDDPHAVRAHDAAHLRRARSARRRVAAARPVGAAGCRVPRRPGVLPGLRAAAGRGGRRERGLPRGAVPHGAQRDPGALAAARRSGARPPPAGLRADLGRAGAGDALVGAGRGARPRARRGRHGRRRLRALGEADHRPARPALDRRRAGRRDDGAQGARRRPPRHRRRTRRSDSSSTGSVA